MKLTIIKFQNFPCPLLKRVSTLSVNTNGWTLLLTSTWSAIDLHKNSHLFVRLVLSRLSCPHQLFRFYERQALFLRTQQKKCARYFLLSSFYAIAKSLSSLLILFWVMRNFQVAKTRFLCSMNPLQFSNLSSLIILHCSDSHLLHFDDSPRSRPNKVLLPYLILYWKYQQLFVQNFYKHEKKFFLFGHK